jgi:hypothetical protein
MQRNPLTKTHFQLKYAHYVYSCISTSQCDSQNEQLSIKLLFNCAPHNNKMDQNNDLSKGLNQLHICQLFTMLHEQRVCHCNVTFTSFNKVGSASLSGPSNGSTNLNKKSTMGVAGNVHITTQLGASRVVIGDLTASTNLTTGSRRTHSSIMAHRHL